MIREMDIIVHRNLYAKPLVPPKWPPWHFDEVKACGGHDTKAKAHAYDTTHGSFRDFKQEAHEISQLMRLDKQDTILDAGCGTGNFSVHAASSVKEIHAVDISKTMMKIAHKKARKQGVENIHFKQSSLLTLELPKPVDAIVCTVVLHHLPDFWKWVALKRLRSLLKPGGQLYLFDVVFSFDPIQYSQVISQWIKEMDRKSWLLSEQAFKHIKYEYSTYDWIMEGLLNKAGFTIKQADYPTPLTAWYLAEAS